ncbi:MAG: UMP kinase [Sulfolobales archaeon]
MRRIVLKISGKIIDHQKTDLIKRYGEVIRRIYESGDKIAVVTGGGEIARSYIRACRELTSNESFCDLMGIEISRINALLLAGVLEDLAYGRIPRDIDQFLEAWSTGRVVVLGGIQPGQSTSAVAAAIAELIRADFLIYLTIVRGVYDRDPSQPDAVLLREVDIDMLENILSKQSFVAGGYELIDPVAIKIIKRSRINTFVTYGYDPENIMRILSGEIIGTRITYRL